MLCIRASRASSGSRSEVVVVVVEVVLISVMFTLFFNTTASIADVHHFQSLSLDLV